jgi:plastocyanin/methionine-rich copper-binding protein CopC
MIGPKRPVYLLLILGISILLLSSVALACGGSKPTLAPEVASKADVKVVTAKLPDQLFAAHYVDSYPLHGDVFAQASDRVQIDFNFTLHELSSIIVTRDGTPIDVGPPTLGPRNLSLWVKLQGAPGDGLYLAKYKACWPDRSCHDGQFAFTVDSKTRASYLDLTSTKEVQIEMKNIKFQPAAVIVSKGTKVVWTNRDAIAHFVNTDPHPSHNVLLELNSLDLALGQSYSFTFTEPGEWGYHCSAHFPEGMVARVIVQP